MSTPIHGNVGKRLLVIPLEMETPSTPKSVTPKKPVYTGNVETSGDTWTDIREATKVLAPRAVMSCLTVWCAEVVALRLLSHR